MEELMIVLNPPTNLFSYLHHLIFLYNHFESSFLFGAFEQAVLFLFILQSHSSISLLKTSPKRSMKYCIILQPSWHWLTVVLMNNRELLMILDWMSVFVTEPTQIYRFLRTRNLIAVSFLEIFLRFNFLTCSHGITVTICPFSFQL